MNAKVWIASAIAAGALAGVATSQAAAHEARVWCDVPGILNAESLDPQWMVDTVSVADGIATITWTDGFEPQVVPVPLNCFPTPAPVPPVPEVVPEGPPPVVVTPPPPKAKPPKKAKPRPRPVTITCKWVISHYSGQAQRNMIRKHNLPRSCGRPFNPPVAG